MTHQDRQPLDSEISIADAMEPGSDPQPLSAPEHLALLALLKDPDYDLHPADITENLCWELLRLAQQMRPLCHDNSPEAAAEILEREERDFPKPLLDFYLDLYQEVDRQCQ